MERTENDQATDNLEADGNTPVRLQRLVSAPSHLDLFSGIGGFALAAQWAGLRTIGFAEIDDYASKILKRHWPEVPNFGDVRNVTADRIREPIFAITGGFPCQPYSLAGKRAGKSDDRHLWPEMLRCVQELRPAWVLAENVPGIIGMELDTVLSDLGTAGYECGTMLVPACAVDARHRRMRVWILGYSMQPGPSPERSSGGEQSGPWESGETMADAARTRLERPIAERAARADGCAPERGDAGNSKKLWHDNGWREQSTGGRQEAGNASQWLPEPPVGRVAHGIPRRVDRLKGLGNAIVPQLAEKLLRWMLECTQTQEH